METAFSTQPMTSTGKRKRAQVHFWACIYSDNEATQDIVAKICSRRHQSDTYFFSSDRQSHVRNLRLDTPGLMTVQVRSANTDYLDEVKLLLEPFALFHMADQIKPLLPALLGPVFAHVASLAITPMQFGAPEMKHQQQALSQFMHWLDFLEFKSENYEMELAAARRRMASDHVNEFHYQTDFHAIDLCFHTNLHNYWSDMDVGRFLRDANTVLSRQF
jgi:hypothetical protein